jgi:hypothetical protein
MEAVMSDIVERLDAEIERQRQTRGDYLDYGQPDPLLVEARKCIAEFEAENFALTAGSCDVPNGKIGDEHGHFYCRLEREIVTLKASIADEREDAARGMRDAIAACQPTTHIDAETEYDRGRFCGVMDYRTAMKAIDPASFRSEP